MPNQIRLLLAEDELLIRMCMQEALEDEGYTVVTAADGIEGLAALDAGHPELFGLVTDIRLGAGPDGWALARHARTLNPCMPVVYVTGDSARDWPEKGVPKSVVVRKPYTAPQVTAVISALLTEADASIAS